MATIQWIVLIFGICVAVLGLSAFFFGKKEGANRIKFFGGEFESSSPAVLIFVIGCAVAVASLYFVPRQSVENKVGGTESATTNDRQAHDMRFSTKSMNLSLEQCLSETKKALKAADFPVFASGAEFAHGYAGEYNGIVWCLPSSKLVFFVVSGPDWQVAEKKRVNLERGFSVE
jgi:hypothetical protein